MAPGARLLPDGRRRGALRRKGCGCDDDDGDADGGGDDAEDDDAGDGAGGDDDDDDDEGDLSSRTPPRPPPPASLRPLLPFPPFLPLLLLFLPAHRREEEEEQEGGKEAEEEEEENERSGTPRAGSYFSCWRPSKSAVSRGSSEHGGAAARGRVSSTGVSTPWSPRRCRRRGCGRFPRSLHVTTACSARVRAVSIK